MLNWLLCSLALGKLASSLSRHCSKRASSDLHKSITPLFLHSEEMVRNLTTGERELTLMTCGWKAGSAPLTESYGPVALMTSSATIQTHSQHLADTP